MSDQATLFGTPDTRPPWQRPARELARRTDPETSKAAARSLKNGAASMRVALLRIFATGEQTCEEAGDRAGFTRAQGTKRTSDLLNAGLIEPTGEIRAGSSGRAQRVLRITADGRAALQGAA